MKRAVKIENLNAAHHGQWRDVKQISAHWQYADIIDPDLLKFKVTAGWWEALAETKSTLVVTREYEHLVMAISVIAGHPVITYFRLPHPSGIVYDEELKILYIASTRNPNEIFLFKPAVGYHTRKDITHVKSGISQKPLMPVKSFFLPGSVYIHDLALIKGQLHANAVGMNAVIKISEDGQFSPQWWPKSIESRLEPEFGINYLQLNSIAAGDSLEASFFSASVSIPGKTRPGQLNFPVDKKGVIFSGKTREPMAFGLTRPHSARLHDQQIWVDNSGYGEVGYISDEKFIPVQKMPGWTRGLVFGEQSLFVGTSRVIAKFRKYAPGLDVDKSKCGLHAIEIKSGKIKGSLFWSYGNQIFAMALIPQTDTTGFLFSRQTRSNGEMAKKFFYTYKTN